MWVFWSLVFWILIMSEFKIICINLTTKIALLVHRCIGPRDLGISILNVDRSFRSSSASSFNILLLILLLVCLCVLRKCIAKAWMCFIHIVLNNWLMCHLKWLSLNYLHLSSHSLIILGHNILMEDLWCILHTQLSLQVADRLIILICLSQWLKEIYIVFGRNCVDKHILITICTVALFHLSHSQLECEGLLAIIITKILFKKALTVNCKLSMLLLWNSIINVILWIQGLLLIWA